MSGQPTRLRPLFTWRSAIVESDLTPSQRLVALVLSLHMSERGDSCYPACRTTTAESGLSYGRTRQAIQDLVTGGWLLRETQRLGGKLGTRTTYTAQIPTGLSTYEQPQNVAVQPNLNSHANDTRTATLRDIEQPHSVAVIGNSSGNSSERRASARDTDRLLDRITADNASGVTPPWTAAGITRQQWLTQQKEAS